MDHPNRNIDYVEQFNSMNVYPIAPRFADKDEELNALREKAKGEWSALSVAEQNQLYRGHFRMPFHQYTVMDDKWKLYVTIWLFQFGTSCMLVRFYTKWAGVKNPEHLDDEHWINEWYKMRLQKLDGPFTGMAAHYDYVDKVWKKQPLVDRILDMGGMFNYAPFDPKDGTDLGFSYLHPSKQ